MGFLSDILNQTLRQHYFIVLRVLNSSLHINIIYLYIIESLMDLTFSTSLLLYGEINLQVWAPLSFKEK